MLHANYNSYNSCSYSSFFLFFHFRTLTLFQVDIVSIAQAYAYAC